MFWIGVGLTYCETFDGSLCSHPTPPSIACSCPSQWFPPAPSSLPSPSPWVSLQVRSAFWVWAVSHDTAAKWTGSNDNQRSSKLTNFALSARRCTWNHGAPICKQRFTCVAVAFSAASLSFPPCSFNMYSILRQVHCEEAACATSPVVARFATISSYRFLSQRPRKAAFRAAAPV